MAPQELWRFVNISDVNHNCCLSVSIRIFIGLGTLTVIGSNSSRHFGLTFTVTVYLEKVSRSRVPAASTRPVEDPTVKFKSPGAGFPTTRDT